MGLASSQARLLLITARKSDLEYRSQMISQRKLTLASQTEQLATDYTKALSNKVLKFAFAVDANGNQVLQDPQLNYNGVVAQNAGYIGASGKFVVTNANGELVVPSMDKLPAGFTFDATKGVATHAGSGESFKVDVEQGVMDKSLFQNALRTGSLYITQYNPESTEQSKFQKCSLASDFISDVNDTSDDSAAEAKYESQSLLVQNQDKQLDLELSQIESQHKALETEYDSVKKVIEKNIEVSYKIFANG